MNRGEIKKTLIQFKKHKLQMKDREIDYISSQLGKMQRIRFCQYALCKAMYYDKQELIDYLLTNTDFTSDIIEYNATLDKHKVWQKRVLLRLPQEHLVRVNKDYLEKCSLCIVINYQRGLIVTAYYNIKDDSHETLDLSRYCSCLKIV